MGIESQTWFRRRAAFGCQCIGGGAKTADVSGNLTLLGVTKPVTLKAVFNGGMASHPMAKKPAIGFSASGTVKRSEFGMTNAIPVVSDDVNLVIEAEFIGG